jgi:hypothetical protein
MAFAWRQPAQEHPDDNDSLVKIWEVASGREISTYPGKPVEHLGWP